MFEANLPKNQPIISEVERKILTPDQLDDLGKAVLALTRELWVVKDRLMLLETVLDEHGIDAKAKIETMVPSEPLREALKIERKRLLKEVVSAMGARFPEGVEHATKFS